jgi:hypothetical protein
MFAIRFWGLGALEPFRTSRTSRKLDTSGFEATWLEKTRLEVTSRSLGSRKVDSKSLRGHFEVTRLAKTLLKVTRTSRKLNTSGFEALWVAQNIEKT